MSKKVYKTDIEKKTLKNRYYRKVLHTTGQLQLVIMRLAPGEEIGSETHPHTTQFIRVEKGRGKAIVGRRKYTLEDGDVIVIPSGTRHNIIASNLGLKLYTIYSPPEHAPGLKTLHKSG